MANQVVSLYQKAQDWCSGCYKDIPNDSVNAYCGDCKWSRYLERRYNITAYEYRQLLRLQGGGCALCGVTECPTGNRMAVDHDHSCCPTPNKSCGLCVRGILCGGCNRRTVGMYEALPEEAKDWPRMNNYLGRRIP